MVAGKSSCSVQCTTNVPLDSKDFFPESSCEQFSPKTVANSTFHFIYITSPTSFTSPTSSTSTSSASHTSSTSSTSISINFIYITYIIYIVINTIYRCSPSTSLLQNSYDVIYTGFFYTGVLTQELFHRSCYTGVNFQVIYLYLNPYRMRPQTYKLLINAAFDAVI